MITDGTTPLGILAFFGLAGGTLLAMMTSLDRPKAIASRRSLCPLP